MTVEESMQYFNGRECEDFNYFNLNKSILVIEVAAHHVMRHQRPMCAAFQRGLPRRQRDRRHVKGVRFASPPRQQLLHGAKARADRFCGVGIVMFHWKRTGDEGEDIGHGSGRWGFRFVNAAA